MKFYLVPLLMSLLGPIGLTGQSRVVSNETAYHHFFMALAPTSPSIGEPETEREYRERQASFVKHIALNQAQGDILTAIAGEYYSYLADLDSRAIQLVGEAAPGRVLTPRQRAALRSVGANRHGVLTHLIAKLHAELDDQGDQLVTDFIDKSVRPKIQFK